MAKHRSHSVEFKRQVAQEYIAGETLHGLAKRHDLCLWRRAIRSRVATSLADSVSSPASPARRSAFTAMRVSR
jgi:transposase-like protein